MRSLESQEQAASPTPVPRPAPGAAGSPTCSTAEGWPVATHTLSRRHMGHVRSDGESMRVALLLVVAVCASRVSGLGRTLADCQKIAAEFKNTCDTSAGPLDSVAGHAGETVSCTATNIACAGTESNGVCTYQRKMCVTCSEENGVVRIRVQSNGLPLSCYSSSVKPVDQDNDFSVDFNGAVSGETVTVETQDEVDAQICNIQAHSNVPAAANFVVHGTSNLRVLVGVALDGVAYMNQMSALGVDPFYPIAYGDVTDPAAAVEKVDMCLGHPQGAGIYHYHTLSPCVVSPNSQPIAPCNEMNGCEDFIEQGVSTYERKLTVIGLAKDGHVMYGPYLDNGEVAGESGLDVCNGAVGLAECDDSYAYFATTTLPYLVGCFGQGNRPNFVPKCTANPPPAYSAVKSPCVAGVTDAPATAAPATSAPTPAPAGSTTAPQTPAPATAAPTTPAQPQLSPTPAPEGATPAPQTQRPATVPPTTTQPESPPPAPVTSAPLPTPAPGVAKPAADQPVDDTFPYWVIVVVAVGVVFLVVACYWCSKRKQHANEAVSFNGIGSKLGAQLT